MNFRIFEDSIGILLYILGVAIGLYYFIEHQSLAVTAELVSETIPALYLSIFIGLSIIYTSIILFSVTRKLIKEPNYPISAIRLTIPSLFLLSIVLVLITQLMLESEELVDIAVITVVTSGGTLFSIQTIRYLSLLMRITQ